jgi:hypothetical protein
LSICTNGNFSRKGSSVSEWVICGEQTLYINKWLSKITDGEESELHLKSLSSTDNKTQDDRKRQQADISTLSDHFYLVS